MIKVAAKRAPGEALSLEDVPSIGTVRTTILIPAYNEEQALPHVLEAICAVVDDSYEILVVDDGSQDNTRSVAASFACRVISHEENRGKGAAMKTGFLYARGTKIIVIDGDATYPADAIPRVAEQLDHHDLVRCVREISRENMPLVNRIGNQIFNTLISAMHQVEGSDMLSGLYGLRRRHLLAMRLKSDGFDIETEIMVKARAMQLSLRTMSISYNERIGEKKLRPVRDGLAIVKRIFDLAVMLNPVPTYILPGALLWLIALIALLLLGRGPLSMPFGGLSINTFIVSAMAFLAGFQLIVFGCLVNLYAVESGFGRPSRTLGLIATRSPRIGGTVVGVLLVIGGSLWAGALAWAWFAGGAGPFTSTEALVVALALIVWGVQLLSTMLLLSLFAGQARFSVAPRAAPPQRQPPADDQGQPHPDHSSIERAVGEV